jgi:ectoine hydroxylase-related dioxygenase (phytanoyl-CoA dioxygenase family)
MVDPTLVDAFETEGAAAVRGLLSDDWIRSLRDALPEILESTYDPTERMSGAGSSRVRSRDGIWRECEPFARFLFLSPVGELASDVMRSSTARLYEDLLLHKDAGASGEAGWHRDAPHWPLRGTQMSSVWFSLEAVTRDTGAMKFVAGSHLDSDEEVQNSMSVRESDLGRRRILTVEAEPGDVVVFHPRVLHTAYGSAPDRPRRTFTLRFMGDDVRWRPRRSMFHAWMRDCGLQKGDALDHPWFPVVGRSSVACAATL